MSCKRIQQLLIEAKNRQLSKSELDDIEQHLVSCPVCADDKKWVNILNKLFEESNGKYGMLPIPQEVMKTRVELQMRHSRPRKNFLNIVREPVWISLLTFAVIIIGVMTFFQVQKTANGAMAYEVALNGVTPDMVEDNDIICDMLYDVGLTEAAVEVVGCDTTCALVIYDLKTKKEAEMVVNIFNAIEKSDITTDVKPVKQSVPQSI